MGARKTGGGVERVYEAASKWVACALRADGFLSTHGWIFPVVTQPS